MNRSVTVLKFANMSIMEKLYRAKEMKKILPAEHVVGVDPDSTSVLQMKSKALSHGLLTHLPECAASK
jgi:hypothetical protein